MHDNGEMNLLDYFRVVWKRKSLIAALSIVTILVAFLYSFRLPKLYKASATILPPAEAGLARRALGGYGMSRGRGQGGQMSFDLLSSMASSYGGGVSLQSFTPTLDTYIAILQSRTMQEAVADHFNKTWGPSAGSLIKKTEIFSNKKGPLTVKVIALDPKIAASAADQYLKHMSTMLSRRAKLKAKKQRGFYERQLAWTKVELKKAQNSLIDFQEEHRYIALDPVIKNKIAIEALQAGSVTALEMERNLMHRYLTDHHPEMIAMDRRIFEAKKLMSHQLYGDPRTLPPESPGSPSRKEFFVAKAKLTPLQFKLAQVYRELSFRQSIENSIHQNLESLKYTIDNPPSVYIDWLDHAVPPGSPFYPIIGKNVAAATLVSLVVGIILAFFLEHIKRIRILDQRKRQTVE